MPTQGDPDLFSEEKQFDIGKFNRAGKTINDRLADYERRKSQIIYIVLGVIGLLFFFYIIIPSSDAKQIKKRTRQIIESLNGPLAALDLKKYTDSEIDTDISVMGYTYRETLNSEAFASTAALAAKNSQGLKAFLASEPSIVIAPNDPLKATVEGIAEGRDGASKIQAKFRMKMRKDSTKGWILTSVYSRVLED